MEFEECFWPKDRDIIGNLDGGKNGEFELFVSLWRTEGKPILQAHYGAQFAMNTKDTPEQELVDWALRALSSTFGLQRHDPSKKGEVGGSGMMPNLVKWSVKRWDSDEFTFGAYSHVPPGCDWSARGELAKPIDNLVFFAGEATSVDYPSTVHGKYPFPFLRRRN